jgi:hypothetical protein
LPAVGCQSGNVLSDPLGKFCRRIVGLAAKTAFPGPRFHCFKTVSDDFLGRNLPSCSVLERISESRERPRPAPANRLEANVSIRGFGMDPPKKALPKTLQCRQ